MFGKYLASIALALLIQLIGIGWGQTQFPCSNVVQYIKYGNTEEIQGYVEIRRVPIGVTLHIRMSLSVAATLPTGYVGKLELAESKERAVEGIRQGWPLTYRVHFPVQRPVPRVTRIELNNEEYCSERPTTGPFVTTIILEHTLSPPGGGSQLSNPSIEGQTPSFYSDQSPIFSSQPIQTESFYLNESPSHSSQSSQTSSFYSNRRPNPSSQTIQRESFYSNQSPNPSPQSVQIESFYLNQSPSHSSQPIQTPSVYSNRNPNPSSQPIQIESFYLNQNPNHFSQPSQTPSVYSNQNPNPSLQPIQTESFHLIQSPNPYPQSVQKESSYSNQSPSYSSQPVQAPPLHLNPIPSSQSNQNPSSSVTNKPSPEQSAIPMRTTEFNWNLVPTPNSTLVQVPNQSSVSVAGPSSKPTANDTPLRDLSGFENCGRPEKSGITYLISKGDRTQPGDWPWLVAIFVSRLKLEFQCAGNLLTDRHVLTAAHCLKSNGNQELPASTLLAVVGRYKLRGWTEKGSVTLEVSEFVTHSEYGKVKTGFDYDIAVMTLAEKVTFGKLIMPICLWSGPSEIESVVGKTGFVLGWGRDEQGNPVTEEPRIAKVPIVSQEVCLRSNPDFVEVTSNRTFCGGSKDGSGPCNGDSGSGLFMYDRQNRRYHLRGLVSLSLLDRETGACDLAQFVVFTDIAKYLSWIQEQITSKRIS